ncbi:hypothetical protein [Azospirillum sp. TSO5]|uniref:hypothetical protein n=1 Tax=Azospirillum sp. TSO5 TaxID=716760 RepID=UPI0011B24CC2|nr:hypothetical protein [Azospirillum sp. TSO5]
MGQVIRFPGGRDPGRRRKRAEAKAKAKPKKVPVGRRLHFLPSDDPVLVRNVLHGLLSRFGWHHTAGLYSRIVRRCGQFDIRGDEEVMSKITERIEELLSDYVVVNRLVRSVA